MAEALPEDARFDVADAAIQPDALPECCRAVVAGLMPPKPKRPVLMEGARYLPPGTLVEWWRQFIHRHGQKACNYQTISRIY